MSIQVSDFRWEPGKNDAEYIKLLKSSRDEWQKIAQKAIAKLKAREPDEDWISRKRLRDEIQYYIEEAGWGDEVNKVLGWCLEFIDNQEAVKWDG